MTSHRRNLLLLWDLGFISFRLWLNEHFFLPQGISIIIATVIGNTMAQQCVATKKKSKYHSTSIIVFYNVIINLGCSKHQRKKHSISRNWQNFMHTKVKSIRGRWAITWALTLISSHFNQKYFLNVHSFPFAASYCIYSFCSSYCSVWSFLQLNNAFMVHFCIIKMQCWVNDEEIWTNH